MEQRYAGPIECLVVFDQSPTVDIPVTSSTERKLRVLTNKRTPGLAGTRNTGALSAKGEFLAFCDDDDEWLPEKLRLQVELLMTNQDAGAAACGMYVCYDGREILRMPKCPLVTFRDLLRSRHMEINPVTMIVRRAVFLEEVGLLDEAIPGGYGEDYDWLLRAAQVTRVTAVREPLVRINWHQSSWFGRNWDIVIAGLRYLLEKYPEFQEEPKGLARIYGQIAFAYAALGRKNEALVWARECLRLNNRESRGYVTLLIVLGLVHSNHVIRVLHLMGRGI